MKRSLLLSCLLAVLFSSPNRAQIWGTHPVGGAANSGALYRTDIDGTDFTILREFNAHPSGAHPLSGRLVKLPSGKMYGTTEKGGVHNDGVIFEYDPATNAYSKKFDFERAVSGRESRGSLMLASNGMLYGVTYLGGTSDHGVVFKFDPATSTYTNIHHFSVLVTGGVPTGQLVESGGKLYGVAGTGAVSAGQIFEVDLATNAFTAKKIEFANDGPIIGPQALTKTQNGKIYGVATQGGAANVGVIFEYDPVNNVCTKRAEFDNTNGAFPTTAMLEAPNGKFYMLLGNGGGSGKGAICEFDPTTNTISKKQEFTSGNAYSPAGEMIFGEDGKMYGIHVDGSIDTGFIFQYDYLQNQLAVVFRFVRETGIRARGATLTLHNGMFYGLLSEGGAQNAGVLFSYDPVAKTSTTKVDFIYAPEGVNPRGGLTLAPNGKLYGTTDLGGTENMGTIYEFNPANNTSTKKFDFTIAFGGYPKARLTLHPNGKLYGVMTAGGLPTGLVYEFDPATGTAAKFPDTFIIGLTPAELTVAANGKLYALLSYYNFTGVMEFDPASNKATIPAQLPIGSSAYGSWTLAPNNKLYAVTNTGGSAGYGIILEYDPATNALEKIFDFVDPYGRYSSSTLALGTNGKLYGTTQYTNNPQFSGTIFELNPANRQVQKKKDFVGGMGGTGVWSESSLVMGEGGKLYGTTWSSGTSGNGALFEYDYVNDQLSAKSDLPFKREPAGTYVTAAVLAASPAQQRIFLSTTNSKPYSIGSFQPAALATSSLPVTYLSSNPDVAVASGSIITIKGMGTTTLTATQNGNSFFNAAPTVEQELTITIGIQTITFNSLESKPLNSGTFTLAATSSSGLPITYTSSNMAVATISGNTVTIVGVGITTITASQAGNSLYAPASANQDFTVLKNPQTITFDELPEKTFGDAPFTLTALASSGLTVSYTSSNLSVATLSSGEVTIVGAGSTDITAVQIGDATTAPAMNVVRVLTVDKANQTITFNPTSQAHGTPVNLTATSSSGLSVSLVSLNDILSPQGDQFVSNQSGVASVRAEQAGNANYKAASPVEKDFCINPLKPVVTTLGDETETITLTSSSLTGNQWFKDGVAIDGATGQSFATTAAGTYQVQVSVESCKSELSSGLAIVVTGDPAKGVTPIQLFPNPAMDRLFVQAPCKEGCDVWVMTIEGKQTEFFRFNSHQTEINLSQYTTGTYLLRIIGTRNVWNEKFIRK